MSRQSRSFCIVGAIVAVLFALTAPAFAGGFSSCQQVQAVYAAPLVQQVIVPQYQYVQPLIQRQVIQQAYVQPVVQQQIVKQRVVAPVQKQVIRQRIVQPRVQRQVIRTRNVQAIQAY